MMILRFPWPHAVRHVISSAATTQIRPNFILHLAMCNAIPQYIKGAQPSSLRFVRDRLGLSAERIVRPYDLARGRAPPYAGADEDRRPINRLKNFAESTSNATLALGTNLSRNTGDVRVLARVGAEPRIDIFIVAVCFSASGLRRRSPALGL